MNKFKSFLVAMSFTFMASAQYGINVAYQFGASGSDLYSSNMKNSYVGLNAKLTYQYDDYVRLNIGTGYYMIPFEKIAVDGVQNPVSGVNLTVIPLTIGADFSFIDQRADVKQKLMPYMGIDLGWAWSTQGKSSVAPELKSNNFILAPCVGVSYKLTDFVDLHAVVRENLLIYTFRGINEDYEIFSLLGFNIGASYKF